VIVAGHGRPAGPGASVRLIHWGSPGRPVTVSAGTDRPRGAVEPSPAQVVYVTSSTIASPSSSGSRLPIARQPPPPRGDYERPRRRGLLWCTSTAGGDAVRSRASSVVLIWGDAERPGRVSRSALARAGPARLRIVLDRVGRSVDGCSPSHGIHIAVHSPVSCRSPSEGSSCGLPAGTLADPPRRSRRRHPESAGLR
jgi:hypothetical protein